MLLLGLALLAWVVSSVTGLHDRLAKVSTTLAAAAVVAVLLILLMASGAGLSLLVVAMRAGHRLPAHAKVAADPLGAAAQSVTAAQQQVTLVADEIARQALSAELATVSGDLASRRYTIVVFGTGSAGKTSVINALLGRTAGTVDPITGTTQDGQEFTYTLDSFGQGSLRLVDTPGLSEFGEGGLMREERARELATQADLLLFVVDQDLRDIEFRPLSALARLGKRSLLVFNKKDLYPPQDLESVAVRLRERVREFMGPESVVICAADPAPVVVRDAAGRVPAQVQSPASDVGALADRIAAILRQEGRTLLANNVLLRARRVSEKARELIQQARLDQARAIVSRFQWTTAAVLFVNPVPGLGALAAAAINYQMVAEIAKVFGVPLAVDSAKKLAIELGQVMVKMGVVSVAVEILGKALKASVVGYVAGGAVEAVAGAYLTRLSGEAFIDYFARDQDWGEGGIQGAIERRFKLERQGEFIAEFIREATRRVFKGSKGASADVP